MDHLADPVVSSYTPSALKRIIQIRAKNVQDSTWLSGERDPMEIVQKVENWAFYQMVQNKRTCWIVDFAIPVDDWVIFYENEKEINKYDLPEN